jgi:hypothetical protein
MKKYLLVLPVIAFMLLGSGYSLAIADSCCAKTPCTCIKGGCCVNGKCSCKGDCCTKGSCHCADGKCSIQCNCQKQ